MEAPKTDKPRKFLRATQALSFAALVVFALHAGLHFGGKSLDSLFNDWVYNILVLISALSCLARAFVTREHRTAWTLLGAGLLAWTAAEVYSSFVLSNEANPPAPSLSDYLWLAFYPMSYVALVLLARDRLPQARLSLWLDGVVVALAVCALGEATVFHTVAKAVIGQEGPVQMATDLAYPIGDTVMLALVASVFALTGWRPGRAWTLIALGLALAGGADSIYVYQNAAGTYNVGGLLDSLWPAATLLIGFAAWEPVGPPNESRFEGWRILVLPGAFALPAIGFLVYDHWGDVDGAAVVLAGLTIVAIIARTAMTFRDNMRMLRSSREEALTDSLTGLGNRRRLMLDLHTELEGKDHARPRALVLLDLDGFKSYNDDFGHPAGDALLVRLGRNLAAAVGDHGQAYRLGGDEFCALVRTDAHGAREIVATATEALSDQGQGFQVSASHGLVQLPGEASDPSAAMQIADQRLYGNKTARQATVVGAQARDVLMQVLHERQPDLHQHLHEVAELSLELGRRLSLSKDELDELVRAAELHDVGKMAIPDEVLAKPGPLDALEAALVRQHTLVGARILVAAPALASVARVVRSSHEKWDGSGYPDGLAGEAIPLASRIILVCDAYHAMTSERPYRRQVQPAEALRELRRCAGTDFDPRVVDVMCPMVEEGAMAPLYGRELPTIAVPDDLAVREP
jgi:diguanylate cyclase (GGDEF)-like protein